MYQFISGIAFEVILIVLFVLGYLSIDGRIFSNRRQSEDYEEWRLRNGRIVKMVCIMTIIVLLASIFSKYIQFTNIRDVPVLQTD